MCILYLLSIKMYSSSVYLRSLVNKYFSFYSNTHHYCTKKWINICLAFHIIWDIFEQKLYKDIWCAWKIQRIGVMARKTRVFWKSVELSWLCLFIYLFIRSVSTGFAKFQNLGLGLHSCLLLCPYVVEKAAFSNPFWDTSSMHEYFSILTYRTSSLHYWRLGFKHFNFVGQKYIQSIAIC